MQLTFQSHSKIEIQIKAAFFQIHHVPLLKAYLLNHVTAIVGNSQDEANTMFPCVATCFRHLIQREGGSTTCGKKITVLKTLSNTRIQQFLMQNITHIEL